MSENFEMHSRDPNCMILLIGQQPHKKQTTKIIIKQNNTQKNNTIIQYLL